MLLEVDHVDAGYGDFQALFDVSLDVAAGEAVAVIGANGAGKSTLLKTIAGLRARSSGATSASTARRSTRCAGARPRRARHRPRARGAADLPQPLRRGEPRDRRLLAGGRGHGRRAGWSRRSRCSAALLDRSAARLSGGEQQALAIGRGADEQPDAAAARRGVARPGTGRRQAALRALPGDPGVGHDAAPRRAGHQPGAGGRRPRLLPAGGAGVAAAARPTELDRDAITAAYFGLASSGGATDASSEVQPVNWVNADRPGRARRRALRAVRDRALAGVRRDAARSTSPTATWPSLAAFVCSHARAGRSAGNPLVRCSCSSSRSASPAAVAAAAGRLRPPRRRRSGVPDRRHLRPRHRHPERAPAARTTPTRVASTSGALARASITITDDVAIGWFTARSGSPSPWPSSACCRCSSPRTRLGRAFRATSDDPDAAQLMGIDNRADLRRRHSAWPVATVALAGVFNGAQTQFAAPIGPLLLIYAFEAVVIGGLGSLWGTLAGGIILGVAQTIGAEIDPRVEAARRAPRVPGLPRRPARRGCSDRATDRDIDGDSPSTRPRRTGQPGDDRRAGVVSPSGGASSRWLCSPSREATSVDAEQARRDVRAGRAGAACGTCSPGTAASSRSASRRSSASAPTA